MVQKKGKIIGRKIRKTKIDKFLQDEFNEQCAADWTEGERTVNEEGEEVLVVKKTVEYEVVDKKKYMKLLGRLQD